MIVLLNFGEFIILDNDLIMVNPLEIIETDNQINRIEDKEEYVKNKYKKHDSYNPKLYQVINNGIGIILAFRFNFI